jgi:hypothetical protein
VYGNVSPLGETQAAFFILDEMVMAEVPEFVKVIGIDFDEPTFTVPKATEHGEQTSLDCVALARVLRQRPKATIQNRGRRTVVQGEK